MDLTGKTILILGGSGLVGQAVARRLLAFRPARIGLVALYQGELERARDALASDAAGIPIEIAWGNVFLPEAAAQLDRSAMLADDRMRELVLHDLLDDLNDEILERSFLVRLFRRFKPHAVVDCINTATAFAYQDVFRSAHALVATARRGPVSLKQVEEHVLSIPVPQLIRHIQIVVEAMREVETQAYVKIGTSGTGGMGLNVPYTHSEERPSRTLLSKSAVAGAHTMMLFLVARTPNAPATVEIKPTAAIGWRELGYGPIRRRGGPIPRVDCPSPLPVDRAFSPGASGWRDTGAVIEGVFADLGENGLFSRDEFETVTALGQMEFITPEEIADYVVLELQGRPTGRDVVAALDAATAGPTYRAGMLRATAIERLVALERAHTSRAPAFEMLGPPRLTKLLYEAFVWSRQRASVVALAESDPVALTAEAAQLIAEDDDLRTLIISVGLPILLAGGKVYRGDTVMVPPADGDLDRAAVRGWVDLRPDNCAVWIERARRVVSQAASRRAGTSSGEDWGAMDAREAIVPSRFATWIFRYEEGGERIKR